MTVLHELEDFIDELRDERADIIRELLDVGMRIAQPCPNVLHEQLRYIEMYNQQKILLDKINRVSLIHNKLLLHQEDDNAESNT